MTVSSTIVSVSYTGNGTTTEFSFPNLFLADDHLVVTVDDVVQTLNSDYTVAGAKDPNGGAVTFTTAPASDTAVKIRRATELLQPLDLVANDRFPAEQAERAWDRLTLISQEAEFRLDSGEGEADRALKYPSGGTHYQAEGRQIKQLAAPTADTDATTQAWVQQEILNAQLGGVDMGTAALADLGTGPDQVPTNAIRDERDSTFTGSNEFIQPLPVGEAVDPGHAVQLGQLTTQYGRTGAEDLPATAQSRKLANYDGVNYLYTGSDDANVRKLTPDGVEVWSEDLGFYGVISVAVDAAGFVYAGTGLSDYGIRKISPDGVVVWTFTGHTSGVRGLAVDEDGFVYSASEDNTAKKISPDGMEVWTFTGHTSQVRGVAVDAAGFVYTASIDQTLRKISPDGTEVWSYSGPVAQVQAVAVDADGFVYATFSNGIIQKVSPDGVEVWTFTGPVTQVRAVAVDAAGFVYAASIDNTVRKLSPEGVEVWVFTGHTDNAWAVAVDAAGFVYSGSRDNTVRKISPDGVEVWSVEHAGPVNAVAVDPGLVGAGFWSVDFPENPRIRGVRIVTEDTNLTPSEIKTAYESNPDTNAYTDSEKSKLDGIESGATADQTASEIKTAYESNADTNAYTDAEKTKVGHIAVSAATDLDSIRTRVDELDAAVVLVGEWDASLGTFPGGGTAGAGESWIVNADGTVDGIEFRVGDRIIALVDGASTTIYAGNWIKADYTDRVSTVHGRTGAVVGQSGDYSASQVTNDSGVSGADVAAALDTLDAAKANSADLGALASQDTVGTADIDNAAATNAKLANMAANTIKARLAGSGAPQDVAIAANRLLARASTGDLEAKELTDFALSLLDDADAATMRTTLGLGSMSTQSASAVAITGGSIAGTNLNTQTADLETMIAQGL